MIGTTRRNGSRAAGESIPRHFLKHLSDLAPLRLHRIEALAIADNLRSVRMLERPGFCREGTRDEGTFHDSAIYGLLA